MVGINGKVKVRAIRPGMDWACDKFGPALGRTHPFVLLALIIEVDDVGRVVVHGAHRGVPVQRSRRGASGSVVCRVLLAMACTTSATRGAVLLKPRVVVPWGICSDISEDQGLVHIYEGARLLSRCSQVVGVMAVRVLLEVHLDERCCPRA